MVKKGKRSRFFPYFGVLRSLKYLVKYFCDMAEWNLPRRMKGRTQKKQEGEEKGEKTILCEVDPAAGS